MLRPNALRSSVDSPSPCTQGEGRVGVLLRLTGLSKTPPPQPSHGVPREGARNITGPVILLATIFLALPLCRADEIYPKHCNAKSQAAGNKGLEYLAKTQSQDGNWTGSQDVMAYPVTMTALAGMAFLANGNTPTRGRYADNIRRIERYLLGCSTSSGLITGPGEEDGRPMYGHGFSMLFLSECYAWKPTTACATNLKK